MLAIVIDINESNVHIYLENGETIEISKEHKNFSTLNSFYETESYFEFEPTTSSIIDPVAKFENLEDYSIPEDFEQEGK